MFTQQERVCKLRSAALISTGHGVCSHIHRTAAEKEIIHHTCNICKAILAYQFDIKATNQHEISFTFSSGSN